LEFRSKAYIEASTKRDYFESEINRNEICPMRTSLVICAISAAFALTPIFGKPVPDNLGNGLNKLVESNLILAGKIPSPASDRAAKPNGSKVVAGKTVPTYNGYATRQAANYAAHAITDSVTKNPMVDIHLSGTLPLADVQKSLTAKFSSLKVTAVDSNYHAGVIEGYVSLDDVVALSQMDGVRSVQLSLKPYHGRRIERPASAVTPAASGPLGLIGSTFDQGVTQHRVDKINQLYNPSAPVNYDGTGMSIGCISDSFDTNGTGYATDLSTKDLPGSGNPINNKPVVVLQDITDGSATDEGRGMCQIAYKMAPRARIGFATADNGEVSFANNIRALAGLPGYTYPAATQQGFAADTICDDVGYFDEPYFQTGIIGQGINDVHAAGVSYFSSAGNDIGINGYDSDLNIVPVSQATTTVSGNTVLLNGTNCNLANVPANLYAGGFHNYNPANPDFAQTVNVPNEAVLAQYLQLDYFLIFQWDDPLDTTTPTLSANPLWSSSGSINGTTTMSDTYPNTTDPSSGTYPNPFQAGQEYVIVEHATSGDFDAQITIYDSSGNQVLFQDTGIDETVYFFPPTTQEYTIKVNAYSPTPGMSTSGTYSIAIYTANGHEAVTTDLNLLVFDMAGNYQASKSLTANNLASNEPIELEAIMGDNSTQLQFVIARANNPPASPQPATHFRWVMPGNGIPDLGPAEYFKYNSPTTGGHAIAAGCNGTAAYSVFRPSIPEYFTSPGPATIYFDDNGNRIPGGPLIRQQPSVAAADGGNTSFFDSESDNDLDDFDNFYGTSAAGPHAAAVGALVLEAHGGPRSVTPTQLTTILHNTAFPHDLDPLTATGVVTTNNGGTITVTIHSDNEANGGPLSGIGIIPGFTPPTVPPPSTPVAIPNTGTGEADPNSISISYTGTDPRSITGFTFNPGGDPKANADADPTEAGNVTGGNNGVDLTNTYFSNLFPGVVFLPSSVPFTMGTTQPNSLQLTDAVVATPSNAAGAPSTMGTAYWTLGLKFGTPLGSNFVSGKALYFTIGRGEQHSAAVQGTTGNEDPSSTSSGSTIDDASGDLWGGGVLIPEGTISPNGMKFTVTLSDGSTVSGRMVNQIGHGYTPLDGYGFLNAEAAVNAALPVVQLNSVVSRKIHGNGYQGDIPLPLIGNPGIECRSGGSSNTFTLVFTFANTLTSVSSASVTSGTGSVASSAISTTDAHQYIVNLTGVTNAQRVTVTLTNLSDSAGNFSQSVGVTMGVLLGDVDASGRVDSADVATVRQNNLQNTSATNFRTDLDESGRIDSNDVFITRQQNLTSLP
jgi:hypothetical protein